MTTVLTVILVIVSLAPTSDSNGISPFTCENSEPNALTMSPKAWKLFSLAAQAIEDIFKSMKIPEESRTQKGPPIPLVGYFYYTTGISESAIKDVAILKDFSLKDMKNGVRLSINLLHNAVMKASAKLTAGGKLLSSSNHQFRIWSKINLDIKLDWNNGFHPSTDVQLDLSINNPFACQDKEMAVFESMVNTLVPEVLKKAITSEVEKAVNNQLNLYIQILKELIRKNLPDVKIFDNDTDLQWEVQNQYLRVALISKSKNQTSSEVQPFNEMFSVGSNLLKVLSAALSDEKAIIATQEQEDEKYLNCVAPRALCNGADCQFFFNVDVVSTPKYFGDFLKCFSYE